MAIIRYVSDIEDFSIVQPAQHEFWFQFTFPAKHSVTFFLRKLFWITFTVFKKLLLKYMKMDHNKKLKIETRITQTGYHPCDPSLDL